MRIPMFNISFTRGQADCELEGGRAKPPALPSPHRSAEEVLIMGLGVAIQDTSTHPLHWENPKGDFMFIHSLKEPARDVRFSAVGWNSACSVW